MDTEIEFVETGKSDAYNVYDRYNRHYLRAEYYFVHASARMAARWEEFAEDGDDYNLQYRTAGDNRVREEHQALEGVTLPFSDPFWEEFMPPNGWNCRCLVVQVRKSKYPVTHAAEARRRGEDALRRDTRGMFRFNPGTQQKTVPDYNPYTISACRSCPVANGKSKLAKSPIPPNQLCDACRFLYSCEEMKSARIEKNKKEYERLKNDSNYTKVVFDPKTGGLKADNINHNFDKKGGDYERHVQNAGFKNGHSVILEAESMNVFKKRNTEGFWDYKLFEIAGRETATSNNVLRGLKHCAAKKETQIAILDFPNGGFNEEIFFSAYKRYCGLEKKNDGQFLKFEKIICVQNEEIVFEYIP